MKIARPKYSVTRTLMAGWQSALSSRLERYSALSAPIWDGETALGSCSSCDGLGVGRMPGVCTAHPSQYDRSSYRAEQQPDGCLVCPAGACTTPMELQARVPNASCRVGGDLMNLQTIGLWQCKMASDI